MDIGSLSYHVCSPMLTQYSIAEMRWLQNYMDYSTTPASTPLPSPDEHLFAIATPTDSAADVLTTTTDTTAMSDGFAAATRTCKPPVLIRTAATSANPFSALATDDD